MLTTTKTTTKANLSLTRTPATHRRGDATKTTAVRKPMPIAADLMDAAKKTCVGLALAATMGLSGGAANAGEIEILATPKPTEGYIVDDAGLMSRSTAGAINKELKQLEDETGYHLNVMKTGLVDDNDNEQALLIL